MDNQTANILQSRNAKGNFELIDRAKHRLCNILKHSRSADTRVDDHRTTSHFPLLM